MARNEQLVRQHRLLQILEASRYGKTLAELRDDVVQELGLDELSERTVRRDLEALQAGGFDVDAHQVERGTVWKLGPRMRDAPPITATAAELVALSMGRDLLLPLSGTPFWQALETLWNKMKATLPEVVWKHFDRQRANLVVRGAPPKSYAEKQGILSTLNRAITQHRVVEADYRSSSSSAGASAAGPPEARTRRMRPLMLVLYRGSLYLVADAVEDPPGSRPRQFKLDRFDKATALDERFEPRADFDPDEFFGASLGIWHHGPCVAAKVRVAPEAAAWIAENPWHPDQELAPQPDGSVVVTLRSVYVQELLPRVLALSDAAELLEPADLRRTLHDLHARLAKRYA